MQSNPFSSVQKNRALPVGAILLSVFLGLSFLAVIGFAQVTDVSTNQPSYGAGDSVVISGSAAANSLVAVQVANPLGTAILLVTAIAGSDGSFVRTFKLPIDSVEGTYTVTTSEGGSTRTATFNVGPPGTGTGAPTPTAAEHLALLDAAEAKLLAGNIEDFMAFFADDAVATDFEGNFYNGKEEVRGWFSGLVADNLQFELLGDRVVEATAQGDAITSTFTLTSLNSFQPLGVLPLQFGCIDVFTKGKITSVTCSATPESLAKLGSALAIAGVAQAHGEALAAADIDAVVAFYADDAVLTIEPIARSPYKELYEPGKAGARDLFQTFFDDVTSFENLSFQVEGNAWKEVNAFGLKSFDERGFRTVPLVGTTTYVVENGKIQSWTFTWSPESLAVLALNAAQNGQEMTRNGEKPEMMTGPAGPAGPAGASGTAGPQGPPGSPGAAGGGDSALAWAALAIAIIAIAIAGLAVARGRKK